MSANVQAEANGQAEAVAPLVVFRDVVKRFGEFTAVERLDLEISRGEFVAIMGPSGCGKTTILRMLAGLERPTEGEIRISGRRMNEVKPSDRDTPMVWQTLALFPFLDVRRNVEFGLRHRGVGRNERRRRALEWLERLGLAEFANRSVEQLSGGQRQRVSLARALVTEPEILLLDEPLSALDANLVLRMQGVLTRLHRELGITFVYVTHSQSEAFAMAERVVIMSTGRVEQVGTPREIFRAPANRFVAEFVGANNILSGTVSSISNGAATVRTGLGDFTVSTAHNRVLASGEQIELIVGADRIALATTAGADENVVPCTYVSEQFVGAIVTLLLQAADGSEVRVQKQQSEIDALDASPGATVYASWRPDQVFVLPPR